MPPGPSDGISRQPSPLVAEEAPEQTIRIASGCERIFIRFALALQFPRINFGLPSRSSHSSAFTLKPKTPQRHVPSPANVISTCTGTSWPPSPLLTAQHHMITFCRSDMREGISHGQALASRLGPLYAAVCDHSLLQSKDSPPTNILTMHHRVKAKFSLTSVSCLSSL